MKFGVVVFPGSTGGADCKYVLEEVLEQEVVSCWHADPDIAGIDCIVIPGGFPYGGYLRGGAIARYSPIVRSIENFAAAGGFVIGISSGFQLLLEAGVLPGALIRNTGLKFICRYVDLVIENADTPWTRLAATGDLLSMPVACEEGSYQVDQDLLARMTENSQIVLRYCSPEGTVGSEWDPVGSVASIAGICNSEGNVFGLMPHLERASERVLGSDDGLVIWKSILSCCGAAVGM